MKMEFPDPKYRDICSIETLYSCKNGFFSELSLIVMEKVGNNWVNTIFASKKSEEDKIRICCTESNVWNIIQESLKNIKPVYREKSALASHNSRLEGKKLHKEKNYKKAIILFSQSIIRAPSINKDCSVDEGLSLPLAYKERAKSLYEMGFYEKCLDDLQMSIKEGIPNSAKHETYRKMGQCYIEMQDFKKARISLQVSVKMAEDQISQLQKASKNKEFKDKYDKLIQILNKDKKEVQKLLLALKDKENPVKVNRLSEEMTAINILPELSGSVNESYPNASNMITIKRSIEAGRFAVAADNIKTGATLVIEKAFASCLIPEMFSSHCHHCYSKLNTAVPCRNCSGVAFCNTNCRDAAISSYHKYECSFMGLFIGSGMSVLSFLALRMVTQEKISFFKELYKKIQILKFGKKSDFEAKFSEKEVKYMNTYNLVTHSNMRKNEDYFRRTLMAIFLIKCLKQSNYFEDDVSINSETLSEDEILMASLILRHLQVLQFNTHEIYETKVKKPGQTQGSKPVYIGVGIYPTAALFNHECAPAATRYFHGNSVIIRAVRPIKKGEIISENYGPNYAKKPLPERIRELTSRYWFQCRCDACYEDWPDIKNLTQENFRLRCPTPDCTGLLNYPSTTEKQNLQPRCRKCLNKINLSDKLKKLSRIESFLNKGIDYMNNNDCDKATPSLVTYMDEVFKLGVPPSREIFLCQEALRTCFAQTGNIWILD